MTTETPLRAIGRLLADRPSSLSYDDIATLRACYAKVMAVEDRVRSEEKLLRSGQVMAHKAIFITKDRLECAKDISQFGGVDNYGRPLLRTIKIPIPANLSKFVSDTEASALMYKPIEVRTYELAGFRGGYVDNSFPIPVFTEQ